MGNGYAPKHDKIFTSGPGWPLEWRAPATGMAARTVEWPLVRGNGRSCGGMAARAGECPLKQGNVPERADRSECVR
jgi:hypothetical protein